MKSLKTRMIVIFSVMCNIILLISMLVCAVNTSGTTQQLNNENLNAAAEQYSEKIYGWFKSAASVVETLSLYMESRKA